MLRHIASQPLMQQHPNHVSQVDTDLLSLHHSFAEASHEQHALLATLQSQLQGVTDRLAASALELDMLRAEMDNAREQVRLHQPV
jgi:hypothetical protein